MLATWKAPATVCHAADHQKYRKPGHAANHVNREQPPPFRISEAATVSHQIKPGAGQLPSLVKLAET